MGFLAEAQNQHKGMGRNATKQAEIEKKLGPKDYKEFLIALEDPTITSAAVARALKNRGIECAPNTIQKIRERMTSNDSK